MNQCSGTAGRHNGFFFGLSTGLLLAGAIACGTTGKENVAKTALDAMPKSERHDTFEATARILDERPELVDELYGISRNHPKMLDRFVADASNDLSEKDFAELATGHLTEHPDAVEMVIKVTLDKIQKSGPSRAAMNRALFAKALPTMDIVTDDPNELAALVAALPAVMEKKPAAQKVLLVAIEKDRAKLLAFAKANPELSKKIAEQVIREEVKDKPELEKILRAAKIIDDTPSGIGDTKKPDAPKKPEEPKKVEDKKAPDVKTKAP